jgi:hexosaminidase
MKFIKLVSLLLALVWLSGCQKKANVDNQITIIPLPVKMTQGKGWFQLQKGTKIRIRNANEEENRLAAYFNHLIKPATGFNLSVKSYDEHILPSDGIVLSLLHSSDFGEEGYRLEVRPERILISANTSQGLFYGIQTIRQMLPLEIESKKIQRKVNWQVPVSDITDYPHFPWRGMHLDVSRHFFDKQFIKEYIDLIAFHKMNVFHWHLVDDQGWRIEIKKYPKLTKVGAWRVDREDQPWDQRVPQKPGEKATYGGFYTQEDIKEIVAYAAERYVAIVPEIEMPAHVTSAIAAYPEFSCTGKKITVPPGGLWPITDIYCAGNDKTFDFLEDVLTEVMELFPGEYIHIGGDEADKAEWKKCPKCQARIRKEGLKDEKELQSYFIRRIEKFLNSHNQKLVGWDEILEGGLAPEATVMSWRGMAGGVEAAEMGHDVVMTPGSHCYFDHYQADPATEPKAWGGFTTLKKVYSFNPVPQKLDQAKARHILGAQGNVWTEYMKTPEKVEYMILPRMTALSEVLWSTPESRDWENFSVRMEKMYKRFEQMGVNYSEGSFQVSMRAKFDPDTKKVVLELSSEQANPVIYYTMDGSDPNENSQIYKNPIPVTETTSIKAAIIRNGEIAGNITTQKVWIHKASGKKVSYQTTFSDKYTGGSDYALVDGIKGSKNLSCGYWQGFNGDDLDITIDLGKTTEISKVSVSFLQDIHSWIFLPEWVEVFTSEDGSKFVSMGKVVNDISPREGGALIKDFKLSFDPTKAKEVRIHAKNMGTCPPWHSGKGGKVWIFTDEVVVE